MDINELTLGQIKELTAVLNIGVASDKKKHDFEVGKAYFIRTVTHHYLGKVVEICDQCIVVKACVWVADSGRFREFLTGEWSAQSEREPFPRDKKVQLFIGSFIDGMEWDKEIPESEK